MKLFSEDAAVDISDEYCYELYAAINFQNMTVDELEEAFHNPQVPHSLLCQGLLTSLKRALGKPAENNQTISRVYLNDTDSKRGRDFEWSGVDFDTDGVIYWLGTQSEDQTFKNPHDTNALKCLMSTCQSGTASNLVSRDNRITCTRNAMESFISIDISPSHFVLKPSHYSLKHGHSRDNVNLRRWKFQASNDGENWDTLSMHDPDESLGGNFGTRTWKIENCDRWYKIFRVVVIGKWFLQVCGIELYGNLLPRTLDAAIKRRNQNQ